MSSSVEKMEENPVDVSSQLLVVHLSDREISAEIIEACRLGDRDAFGALYDVYKTVGIPSRRLYGFEAIWHLRNVG